MKQSAKWLGPVIGILIMVSVNAQDYTWQRIPFPSLDIISCSAISPLDQIYVGTDNGEFIYRTDDRGETWIQCPMPDELTGENKPPKVLEIEISPSGVVYANVILDEQWSNSCGIYKSLDAGSTWDLVIHNSWCDPYIMTMAQNGDVYIMLYESGIAIYPEGIKKLGDYFQRTPIRANSKREFIKYLYLNWDDYNTNYDIFHYTITGKSGCFYFYSPAGASAMGGAYNINSLSYIYITDEGILYRSVDKGESFEPVWSGGVGTIEIDANDYIYITTGDGIMKSENHGNTWTCIRSKLKWFTELDWNHNGNILAMEQPIPHSHYELLMGVNNVIGGRLGVLLPASEGYEIPMLEEFRIRWTHLGNVGNEIRIELYEDHVFKNTIAENTGNDGAFDWMVTRHAAEDANYQFKVTSLEDPAIYAWSPTFKIVKAPGTRVPKSYTAKRVPQAHAPVIDGNPDEAVWDQVEEAQTLDFGGTPGAYNTAWMDTSDANVSWKALWCGETNKLYVAVTVEDDVRGAFDNAEGSALYSPAHDESIEIMTDGNANGGNFLELFEPAQYWRITAANQVNLVNYPTLGDHPYMEDSIISAVHLGENGNWTCEFEMTVYDAYPSAVKTLATGDQIGWELWYNDSDNETDKGSYYAIDHQIGWMYWGQSWKHSDFSGDLILGDLIGDTSPQIFTLTVESVYGSLTGGGDYSEGEAAPFSVDSVVTEGDVRHLFTGWTGDFTGMAASGEIMMDGHKTVTAFWNTQYLLRTSVQGEEGGTVVPGDSVWVDEGETVEVTAVHDADGGYVFSHWTGDIESNENPLIVNMDSPITIEAVFESATSVEAENMPLTYGLYQNYPNPFNPSTRIAYDIPETGLVRLEVFDLMGRKVCTLVNDMRQPGSYQAVWNGLDDRGLQAASGTYVYVMRCGDYQKRMKAVFLK